MEIEVNRDEFEERQKYLDDIPATNETYHKCYCGVWLCDIPEKLECDSCKEKREEEGISGALFHNMGSLLVIERCAQCKELVSWQFTPEGSTT